VNPPGGSPATAVAAVQAATLRDGVVHAFSTRQGGVSRPPFGTLNLGQSVGDDAAAVRENRRRFFRPFGIAPERVVRVKQVHGDRTLVVDDQLAGRHGFPASLLDEPAEYDAIITDLPGLALTVSTADCVPILLHDPTRRAVAAIHAGWRGTAARIAAKAVGAMGATFGSRPEDLRAAIGPAIRRCCYEVDGPVHGLLQAAVGSSGGQFAPTREGHWRADLPGLNRAILVEAGLRPDRIEDLGLCTACRPAVFFSHRGERGRTGRMMNFIALLPLAPHERSRPDGGGAATTRRQGEERRDGRAAAGCGGAERQGAPADPACLRRGVPRSGEGRC
jgi:YfiH family protein